MKGFNVMHVYLSRLSLRNSFSAMLSVLLYKRMDKDGKKKGGFISSDSTLHTAVWSGQKLDICQYYRRRETVETTTVALLTPRIVTTVILGHPPAYGHQASRSFQLRCQVKNGGSGGYSQCGAQLVTLVAVGIVALSVKIPMVPAGTPMRSKGIAGERRERQATTQRTSFLGKEERVVQSGRSKGVISAAAVHCGDIIAVCFLGTWRIAALYGSRTSGRGTEDIWLDVLSQMFGEDAIGKGTEDTFVAEEFGRHILGELAGKRPQRAVRDVLFDIGAVTFPSILQAVTLLDAGLGRLDLRMVQELEGWWVKESLSVARPPSGRVESIEWSVSLRPNSLVVETCRWPCAVDNDGLLCKA
uniref:(California timema) hypothetical protein n=1 Tax=Timema californicum TaxID=61474 RepID=A0A7R9PCQ1_TIMCA|nr:unnamed protein product [Timema californicum]